MEKKRVDREIVRAVVNNLRHKTSLSATGTGWNKILRKMRGIPR